MPSFSLRYHINLPHQTSWTSSLAWAAPTLAALLILSPSAHSQTQNICERENALSSDGTHCNLSHKGITSLSSDDFDGLSNLKTLGLHDNNLSRLPEDIFDGLSNLQELSLYNNDLSSLPEDIFDGLSNLQRLNLHDNNLSSLPEDIFDGLSKLNFLYLWNNDLSNLPEDIFDGLSNLQELYLWNNDLSSLPEDIFDGLSNLQELWLYSNNLSSLPEDIFDGLSNLQELYLWNNDLSSLPKDIFDELSNLQRLDLYSNDLSSLPEDIFDGLSNLNFLYLWNNDLSSLPEDIFDGLSNLQLLFLHNNDLSSLPEDIFDGLSNLDRIYLSGNSLICLPRSLSLTVRLIDVDLPRCGNLLILTPSSLTVAEGGSGSYTVALSSEPTAAVMVTLSFGSGATVDTDADTDGNQNTLSFSTSNWNTPQTVAVSTGQDADAIDDTITLSHSASGGDYGLVTANLSVTIIDDDKAPALVLTPESLTVAEGGSGSYTVRLAGSPTAAVTVTVSLSSGAGVTLDTDADTDGNQTTLSFSTSNWNTPQTVTVSGEQDDDAVDDTVTLSHSASGGDYDSVTANLSVTVTDDETAADETAADETAALVFTPESLTVAEGGSGSYTVALISLPTAAVTVSLSSASGVTVDTDTAIDGNQTTLSFSTSNWSTPQTVVVSGEQDDDAIDDTVTLVHTASGGNYGAVTTNLSVTVIDADKAPALVFTSESLMVAEDGSGSYTVRLDSSPTDAVTVTVSASPGVTLDTDADTDGNQTTLNFSTTNWSTPQTVVVSGEEDNDDVDDTVTLSHSASGGDYGAVAANLSVTVIDADKEPALVFAPESLTVAEDGSGSYTVRLDSSPTDAVMVTVNAGAGVTVDTDADTEGNQTSLSFSTANWSTPQTVAVSAGQDADATDGIITLSHSASGGDYGAVAANLSVTVIDADKEPALVFAPESLTVAEGESGSYTVRLDSSPTDAVTVTVNAGAGVTVDTDADTEGNQTSLSFSTTNWSTPQAVAVSAGQDDDTDDDTVTLSHSASGGDYGAVAGELVVTVSDTTPVAGVTSAAEQAAIRAALSGQGRVVLGSVTDMIGERFDSGTAGTGSSGSVCLSSAAGADEDSATSSDSAIAGSYGSYGDGSDHLIASDIWQGESWNTDLDATGLRGVPHVGQRDEDSMDKTFDDLLKLFRGQPHSLHPADWGLGCGSGVVGEMSRPWSLWAGTDLQWARGGTETSDFDGSWNFLYLGADRAFAEQWLAGLSLSQVWGEVDYSFEDATAAGEGQLSSNLTAIYPYLHGQLSSNLELWAIGGFGFGDAENEREHVDGDADQGDLHMQLLSVGLRRSLSRAGSAMDLALSSDAGFVNLSAEGDGSLDGAEASIGRFRLGLELSRPFANGVEPFAQLHGRYDSGDGPTGAAGELVAGMRYGDQRLRLELRGNHLTSAADFEQWGANARLGYSPATNGTGLNLALNSQWGAAENGDSFLDGHIMELPTPALISAGNSDSLAAEISGEIGYSFSMGQQWGLLTPNLGYDHSGNGSSRSRVGLAYAFSSALDRDIELRLDLSRRERRQQNPDHSIELGGSLRF